MASRRHQEAGDTLIEILITIVVIGITALAVLLRDLGRRDVIEGTPRLRRRRHVAARRGGGHEDRRANFLRKRRRDVLGRVLRPQVPGPFANLDPVLPRRSELHASS